MKEIREDMLKVKRMVSDVEMIIGKREGETELVNKLIDAENLLTYCMSRLENAIVPPCKVGDAVWYIEENGGISFSLIEKIRMEQKAGWNTETVFNLVFIAGFGVPILFEQIGEIIFLTREEAEQALEERTDK